MPGMREAAKAFQFHSGLIKRKHVGPIQVLGSLFQFHSGLIKRSSHGSMAFITFGVFQFHSGLIKSSSFLLI